MSTLTWDTPSVFGCYGTTIDFGHTKGILLIDPGIDPALYDEDDGQKLPFTWRGVPKAEPNIFLCNELNTKRKIRITPWERRIEGFFEFIMGNGQAGERFRGDKCAFHAKPHFGPSVVPYTLSDTVELWNYYLPHPVREARVRQFLSPSDLEADLRRRDGGSAITTDGEMDDDISVVSQESSSSQETLTEVMDNSGRGILVRIQVDREGKVVSGRFNGEFRDVFHGQGTP